MEEVFIATACHYAFLQPGNNGKKLLVDTIFPVFPHEQKRCKYDGWTKRNDNLLGRELFFTFVLLFDITRHSPTN